jgi:hypothetical protein
VALDVANCIPDTWFRLGFSNLADMSAANTWIQTSELYQWADDFMKALGRTTAVFLTYDASVNVTPGTAAYFLPAGHVFTEGAWLVYLWSGVQALRLTTTQELYALDATWPATQGSPERLSLDAGDVLTCVLYPNPVSKSVLWLILELLPAPVVLGASVLPCSPILTDAFTYAMIAGALSKESDNAKPEVAAHAANKLRLYAEVAKKLWGPR